MAKRGRGGVHRGGLYRRGKGPTANWWGSVKAEGRWRVVNTWTYRKPEAMERLAEMRAKAFKGQNWRLNALNDGTNFSKFLDTALKVISPAVKERTLAGYSRIGKSFQEIVGDKPVGAITTREVTQFLDARRALGRKGQTLRNDLWGLSAILQVAVHDDYALLERNPVRALEKKPKAEAPVAKALSQQGLNKILNAALERGDLVTYLSVRMTVNTGFQSGESHTLAWEDWDEDEEIIRLKPGKNYSGREMPVNRHVREVLMFLKNHWIKVMPGYPQMVFPRTKEQMRWVFCRADGSSYAEKPGLPGSAMASSPNHLNSLYKNTTQWAKVDSSFHATRHTFATHLEEADADYLAIKKLMGHSTKNDVTARYAMVRMGRLRKAVQSIESMTPDWTLSDMKVTRPGGVEVKLLRE